LASAADELEDLLCPEERERARRLLSERDRQLWIRSRGVLRTLLGRYLDRVPRELCFVLGPHGKPMLEISRPDDLDLRFNLSHSGTLALYAVTAGREVGIDVETARRQIDEVAVAARVLGRAHARRLARLDLDPQARTREFLRAWVSHEAAVKCRGTGLATPSQGHLAAELWTAELDVGPQAAAAVAVEAGQCELCCWDWRAQGYAPSPRPSAVTSSTDLSQPHPQPPRPPPNPSGHLLAPPRSELQTDSRSHARPPFPGWP
jgi:4'-phosphopantetheinyl transferase